MRKTIQRGHDASNKAAWHHDGNEDKGKMGERVANDAVSKTGGEKVVRYVVTRGKADGREQYGIAVIGEQEQIDCIEDIASSLEETAVLAAFLQENGVAAVHFRDVVEDYLAQ